MKFQIGDEVKSTIWVLLNFEGRVISKYEYEGNNYYSVYFTDLYKIFECHENGLSLLVKKEAA